MMKSVCVVDDNESYLELVTLTLEDRCGVQEVHGFASGHPLLRHLEANVGVPPALVLLDLHMPGMGGLELLTRLRRHAPTAPVAFLSGEAADEEREACLAAGAVAFLRKPVAYAELVRALQGLVDSTREKGGSCEA